ncbi:helix-turn-helix transcriptional regulator [Pokkaliibacter sp. MBI-7]|uniref:helix-turn-helix domain-containing protein n=1 Tax=Pokkaliibacter sp. MBI-7 TaxID=3040600 RepID=UPI002446C24A|nr:helix-turn-helix transcriptional regulator [Pokkaliibacter sp. MBI-7]MDH2436147.1 helix-turn-helix transcriptional regulator [Pokkaliibacter sp. MBI-7]
MSQIDLLLTTLKRELKAHGKTYADVAMALELSEASVKRLFAEGNFTLQRLEKVCLLVEMSLSDLTHAAARQQPQLNQLQRQQEEEIAADLVLLLVTVSVINGFSFADLLEHYTIDEHTLIRKLAHLDRLKLIELLPGNRIRLKVSANFGWIADGPIQRFFQEKVAQDFFQSRFDRPSEKLIVLNGLLSDGSNIELQRRMQQLAEEFNTTIHRDAELPMAQRHGNTMVMAIRQWHYSLFRRFSR